jgi:alanine racemase
MQPERLKDNRCAWVEVDLANLENNIKVIKSYRSGPGTKIMAVVKADAYGHGAVEISRRAVKSGADALGVAIADEGILLRKNGIKVPIYILGKCTEAAAEDAIKNKLILTIDSAESAKFYSGVAGKLGRVAPVNINVDTGMNRIGINWKNISEILSVLDLKNLNAEGIFSHFSCAGEKDAYFTLKQMQRFSETREKLAGLGISFKNIHFANSAAFFRFKDTHFNMVRTGISLYGLNPYSKGWQYWLPEKARESVSRLKPVLSLKGRISFVKETASGEHVSYCRTFTTKRDSIIATIPVGYADGYSRILSNRSKVLLGGMEAPVIGNITMDQFMIDVTDISKKRKILPGEEVIIIGSSGDKKISADDLAEIMGTINYEVICMIRSRIPRVYKK